MVYKKIDVQVGLFFTGLFFAASLGCGMLEGMANTVESKPDVTALSNPGHVEPIPEQDPVCPQARPMEAVKSIEPDPAPSKPLQKGVQDSTIVDYYHHFFATPLDSFKDLDVKGAHEKKTYKLGTLNTKNAYLSFSTQNTPPSWDGDSETEWAYELTYWVQSPDRRLIGVNKTEVTWVSSQSVVRFYVHDKDGLRPISPLKTPWKMTDFTDKDYATYFPKVLNNNPPVDISLPQKGKWVEVRLAIQEYFEPQDIYAIFECLKVQTHPAYFQPAEGVLHRKKP